MEKNQKNYKTCDICKVNEATILCPPCFSYYCDKCHKCVHEIKDNKDHEKETIDYNVPIDTRCPDHKTIPINLFCLDEKGKIYSYIIIYSPVLCFMLFFKSS